MIFTYSQLQERIKKPAIFIQNNNNTLTVKYNGRTISEYLTDGTNYLHVKYKEKDCSRMIAVADPATMEGTINDDGTITITDKDIIATFDKYGGLLTFGSLKPIDPVLQIKEQIADNIIKLNRQYSNAIAIFGGAYHIDRDVASIALYLPTLLRHAELWHWHESQADTCRRFCHLCLVDPSLVEAYLGNTFERLLG